MSQDASTFCELDKVMEVARRMSCDPHLLWFEASSKDYGIQPSLKHCVWRIILYCGTLVRSYILKEILGRDKILEWVYWSICDKGYIVKLLN
mgnify:CR=1 FL=1